MTDLKAVCLRAAIIFMASTIARAQAPAEPAGWEQKYEAAAKAGKSGDQAAAEALLFEVLLEAEKLDSDDLRLAKPLERLAVFYMTTPRKRYAEAEPLLRRALAIREKTQGPEHPDVAETLHELAACLWAEKHERPSDGVGPMLRRALAIFEKTKGEDDPDVARVLHGLGLWSMGRGEYRDAESSLLRATAIREKAFGPESAKVADLLDDLGDLHTVQLFKLDLKTMLEEARTGGDNPGESYFDRHEKEARSYLTRALAIREKVLKPDDPEIAESLYNLGQLAVSRGKPVDGESYLGRWLVWQERAKTPASEEQGRVLTWLAWAAVERKDPAEADRRLERALAVLEDAEGAGSDEVASTLAVRADYALDAGRPDDAERLLKRGLDLQSARVGPDDPDVAEARALRAGTYADHAEDGRAPLLWHRLRVLGRRAEREHHHSGLGSLLEGYADLLRRTNHVVPSPTEADLAYLRKVKAVYVSDLESLAKIDNLTYQSPDEEGLSHIARLFDLDRLHLKGTLTAAGLANLKGLVNLRTLTLEGDGIDDAGLAQIAGMEGLEELNLHFTNVTDAGFEHLKGLVHLRRLRVYVKWPQGKREVSDACLVPLRGLEELRTLTIQGAGITDAGWGRLAGLKNLEELHLDFTDVTGKGLDQLKRLDHLRLLDVNFTRVARADVDRLRRAWPALEIDDEQEPDRPASREPDGFLSSLKEMAKLMVKDNSIEDMMNGGPQLVELPMIHDPGSEEGQAIVRYNAAVRARNEYESQRRENAKLARSRPGEPVPPEPPLPPLAGASRRPTAEALPPLPGAPRR